MKRALCLVLPALVLPAAPEVREEILVVVNNHIITRKAFQQAVEQETAALYRKHSGKELDAKLKEAREKTLQGLIDAFVLSDKAAELNLSITDEQIRSYVEDIKQQNQFATDADLERALKTSLGVGLPDYLKQLKQQEVQRMVLGREVYSKVAIEDQELRAYYEDHKDEYKQPSRFRVRELVISKGATPEEQAQARATLEKVQAELKAGKAFEELAKAYSASPSKATGGDLGWMGKGLMRASVEQAALALKPGAVSAPLETDKDLLLLQLIASEDEGAKPFEEVKPQLLQKLQEPKAQNALENYLNDLRIRSNIRFLVPRETILKG